MSAPHCAGLPGSMKPNNVAKRSAQRFCNRFLQAFHAVAPTLGAVLFACLSSAVVHAQGTISFSGAQTFMQTVQTFAMYAGAVICLIGLIFAGVSFMSGNIQRGVIGLF